MAVVVSFLTVSCSHDMELKQEIAAANELLPQVYGQCLVAESISLEEEDVVYNIVVDANTCGVLDLENHSSQRFIRDQIATTWYSGLKTNRDFAVRIKNAGRNIRYHIRMDNSESTLDIVIPNKDLDRYLGQ